MKLGIMQPYLFPYLGYFQLLSAVDKFIVYDDVAFIKQGWVNRNRILVGGKAYRFSVPLRSASSFRSISDTHVDAASYARWLRKFLTTVDQNYRSSPYFGPVRQVLAAVFLGFREGSIAALALRSIIETLNYLDLRPEIVRSACEYGNAHLTGQDRVIDLCEKEGADEYINPVGGRTLYAREDFAARGIALRFIRLRSIIYPQFGDQFTPDLSIIDVMMFNQPRRIRELLCEFDLV